MIFAIIVFALVTFSVMTENMKRRSEGFRRETGLALDFTPEAIEDGWRRYKEGSLSCRSGGGAN
ncbi:MAG: hypothetical protein Q8P49_01215 [Candidatus Liptonbacteria bacterium]|nr:hypothetical protein [Candidatus Liptonbacteria bacterium]